MPSTFDSCKFNAFGFGKSCLINLAYLKKVIYRIIINLQKRTENPKFVIFLFMDFDFFEQLKDGSGNHPCKIFIRADIFEKSILLLIDWLGSSFEHVLPIFSEHGMRFTGTGLPIGKNSHVIAIRDFRDVLIEVGVNFSLCRLLRQSFIEFDRHNREWIGDYINCFSLNWIWLTSGSTLTIYLDPSSWSTNGRTRTITLMEVDFYYAVLFILIIIYV